MRHLKRFQTWLSYIYCAALALREQREQNQFRIYDGAAEELPANPSAIDCKAVESEAAIPCSIAPSETAKPCADSGRAQTVVAAPAEESKPAAVPEKKASEAAVVDKECVTEKVAAAPIAAPVRKIAKDPEPPAQPGPPALAVSQVEPQPAAPVIPKPQSPKRSASAPVSASGKYDPSAINDQTAQRLARLLVSEIKLYYTSVTNGGVPAANNIYDILKDPIDKSRQHYKQRMGATVETMPDYFHGELVRTLCAGDASRLGPNYQSTN